MSTNVYFYHFGNTNKMRTRNALTHTREARQEKRERKIFVEFISLAKYFGLTKKKAPHVPKNRVNTCARSKREAETGVLEVRPIYENRNQRAYGTSIKRN
jgi:hypothetical protein